MHWKKKYLNFFTQGTHLLIFTSVESHFALEVAKGVHWTNFSGYYGILTSIYRNIFNLYNSTYLGIFNFFLLIRAHVAYYCILNWQCYSEKCGWLADVRIAKSCFHPVTLAVPCTDHGSSTAVELTASYGFRFRKGRQFKRGGPKKHTKIHNVEYFDDKRFQTCTPPAFREINNE